MNTEDEKLFDVMFGPTPDQRRTIKKILGSYYRKHGFELKVGRANQDGTINVSLAARHRFSRLVRLIQDVDRLQRAMNDTLGKPERRLEKIS
jgi:hypothetical protein